MVVGTTILRMGATAFSSPQFPRGGFSAVFSLECTHIKGSPTLTVTVQHRNVEDTVWATAGTFSAITTTGVYTLDVTDIKEIVRLSYGIAGSDLEGFHVIVAAPAWRPY
jgi:hypothetical protein